MLTKSMFCLLRPQMFVRLFVDENLDRMVPISKQPKEKIQAIIDSCTRQFPEYAERARKRIRTYLKSCRRNKCIKDGGGGVGVGWESVRFKPARQRQKTYGLAWRKAKAK